MAGSKCESCGAVVFWRRRQGKLRPEDPSGSVHWMTCPVILAKRKERQEKADALAAMQGKLPL